MLKVREGDIKLQLSDFCRELEEELALGMTSEIYLLERVLRVAF